MFPNKFAGKCSVCQARVPERAGFVFRSEGRYKALCSSRACIERSGQATQATAVTERRLEADGTVRMPYEQQALPLLRSMPGKVFDAVSKVWRVSVAPADLPRVLELAAKLRLEVAPELLAAAAAGTAESKIADERAAREGLYEFQREGVRFLARQKKALLGDDMGLGKTVQALVALEDRARVVVICPAAVKYNWRDEIARWRPELKATVLQGRGSFRVPAEAEVVIINPDILPDAAPDGMEGVTIIADEAQAYKGYRAKGGTKRAKRFAALVKAADRVWMLTGTPLMSRPFDLWGLLSAAGLQGQVFGGWNRFLDLFGGYKNSWGGYEFSGTSPEVAERLRNVMLRRLKSEVLPDLPKKRYQTMVVNGLSKAVTKELDGLMTEYGDLFSAGILPAFEEMAEARAALATSRIPSLLALVEEYEESDTPLLVFSAHRAPIDALAERDGWATITGDTSAQKRTEIVRAFQSGELKGVGLTIKAGGVGLTLTRASHVLFVDRDWTPAWNLQAEDRVVRIGQNAESVLIKDLVSDHPLDRRVYELLRQKEQMIAAAVDGQLSYEPSATPSIREESQEELDARLAQLEAASKQAERSELLDRIGSVLEREQAKAYGGARDLNLPPLTAERKERVRAAFYCLIGRCDGAVMEDGAGFNKPDAAIAHWIFRAGLEDSDERSFRLLEAMMLKYKDRQLSEFADLWDRNA